MHGKIESWKDKESKLEVDISEAKQNKIKRKLEAKIKNAEEKRKRLEQEIKTLKVKIRN